MALTIGIGFVVLLGIGWGITWLCRTVPKDKVSDKWLDDFAGTRKDE